MRKLFYQSCSYATPHIGILINSMTNSYTNGDTVCFAYCAGIMTSCFMNISANDAKCKLCHFAYTNVIKKILPNIEIFPIYADSSKIEKKVFIYNSIEDIKHITYKDVNIGQSVLSLYFTLTRNIEFEITSELRQYFDYIIDECCLLTDRAYEIIERTAPDCISIYNGRYYENRMFYDIAKVKDIKFESNEMIGGFNEPFYPVIFDGCLPHDVHFFAKKAKEVWNQSELDEESLVLQAKSFYVKRRNGIAICDKAYVNGQKTGELPIIFEGKKNIVIFNSSSDEFAAVGGEWDTSSLFVSQKDAIAFILENLSNDYYVYLRIHPNLKGVNQAFHTNLYKLDEKYSNLTIIAPEETISSYSLLDIAEKVIVFGSTMGVEACFWGKPVILIGNAFYVDLNVCYQATNKMNLLNLLMNELTPKDIQGSLYYSNYLLDRKYRTEEIAEGIDITPTVHKVLGKKFRTYSYLNICGSVYLFKVIEILYRILLKTFTKDKNKFIY